MSGGLKSGLIGLGKSLKSKSEAMSTLIQDIESMKEGKKNKKPYSRRTVEPMTRIRSTVEELETAKANPDEQFVKDRLHDILGI